jgi:uncharacterized protein with HEPN domain
VPPSLADRLSHILTAIDDIRALTAGRSREAFAADRILRLAVERLLEIISEASRHIPEDVKGQEKEIAWKRLADLGNWLRHAYHRVDPDLLRNMIEGDLAPLERFVRQIVREDRK